MPDNKSEIRLLNDNPGELVLIYQDIINTIIQKTLINPGFLHWQSRQDICQTINERLLIKIPYIKAHYNGVSLLRTYFSVIIRNMCMEYCRLQVRQETIYTINPEDFSAPGVKKKVYKKKYYTTLLQEDHIYTSGYETEKKIILEFEYRRFDAILNTYTKQRAKIELCLKYLFQIPCCLNDLKAYWPDATNTHLKMLIGNSYEKVKVRKSDMYKSLTRLINNCENKNNTDDAIRKWLADKICDLINLLNGDSQQAYFDKETFQYFVEKYYSIKECKE